MCALFPSYFPNFGWPVIEDHQATSHEQEYMIFRDTTEEEKFSELSIVGVSDQPQRPPPQPQADRSASSISTNNSAAGSVDPIRVKKLDHNASERDRRKLINALYSSLRSLLPSADQTKKLSIPMTVSRVITYIPELQQTVERLIQKKEELSSKVCRNTHGERGMIQQQQQHRKFTGDAASVLASRLSDMEILIQISSHKVPNKCPGLSEILLNLEEDGLLLLNAHSFESLEGRIFYSLHLQVETTYGLDSEVVSEKLRSLYTEKRQEVFPSNFVSKNYY